LAISKKSKRSFEEKAGKKKDPVLILKWKSMEKLAKDI
jgi:hypothetical protein